MDRVLALSGLFCVVFLAACTPAMKRVWQEEMAYARNYNYLGTAKKVSDWEGFFPTPKTIEEGARQEYCVNNGYSRQLLITGVSEQHTYGGCILDAPVPYEPHRLQGRP